jgi:hypothetical protein
MPVYGAIIKLLVKFLCPFTRVEGLVWGVFAPSGENSIFQISQGKFHPKNIEYKITKKNRRKF